MRTCPLTVTTRPFPRADQVGSLLRPPHPALARERRKAGALDAATLRAVEDDAIRAIVRRQEELGFSLVVDGEFRRENWWVDFIAALDGVQIRDGDPAQAFVTMDEHGHGESYVPKDVVTTGVLKGRAPVLARDYAFLAGATKVAAKVTLPSPSRLHFHGGRASVSREAYPDIEAFFADVVSLYRAEIAALEAAGCRYVQIDDPLLTYFISDRLREAVRASGEDPNARLARYVRLINDCIAARSDQTTVGVHVCRGNARSAWIAAGGYERVAEAVLDGLQCDHLLLEYDDARSGAGRDRAATGTLAGMLARRVCRRFRATPIAAETMELVLAAAYSDLREKTDPVRVRENPNFLTLERIKKCPKECV